MYQRFHINECSKLIDLCSSKNLSGSILCLMYMRKEDEPPISNVNTEVIATKVCVKIFDAELYAGKVRL